MLTSNSTQLAWLGQYTSTDKTNLSQGAARGSYCDRCGLRYDCRAVAHAPAFIFCAVAIGMMLLVLLSSVFSLLPCGQMMLLVSIARFYAAITLWRGSMQLTRIFRSCFRVRTVQRIEYIVECTQLTRNIHVSWYPQELLTRA